VTMDLLVKLSVLSRISVLFHGYSWRIVLGAIDILVESSVLARMDLVLDIYGKTTDRL